MYLVYNCSNYSSFCTLNGALMFKIAEYRNGVSLLSVEEAYPPGPFYFYRDEYKKLKEVVIDCNTD